MRKILLFPALLFICSTAFAFAGEGPENSVTSTPQVGGLFPHFNSSLAGNSGAVATDFRLIAKSYAIYRDAGFVASDSTTYVYGENRGSVPNLDDLNNDEHVLFDVSVSYKFNTSLWGYDNSQQRLQSYEDNKVSKLIYKKWDKLTSSWKNAERYLYKYDNNGKMQTSLLQLWYGTLWSQDMLSTLNYDNNNNVVQMNSVTYTVDFVYDQNNNLIMIEDKVWSSGSGFTNNERKSYVYNGKDVVEYVLDKWDNGTWVRTTKWEYGYDIDKNIVLSTEYSWSGSSWVGKKQNAYTYDNNNNKLTDIEKIWNAGSASYENHKMESLTYNVKSLPETVTSYTWKNNAWQHLTGDFTIKYYYEQYTPNSVAKFALDADLNIYPLPASDNINISAKWQESSEISVLLTDMAGRTVFHSKHQASNNYTQSIPVHNLPSGNYILSISDKNATAGRKVVVRH